ncbi:MAG: CRISPR-associated helicase Cas3' [Bifidobacteriaceae bacterium]|jgi:CRISPR-associated endonuclease/helicase Cas3|nr:CRISPR-associated helicase Cas3' [Bifidobacteriaceae bacterium]
MSETDGLWPPLARQSKAAQQRVGVLWGKSGDRFGGFALLLGHLLDSAAVGEAIWDSYLSPVTRAGLDRVADGRGRALFALLCGIHDIGKATPSFQSKVGPLWDAVAAQGLDVPKLTGAAARVGHADAGGKIIHEIAGRVGWSRDAVEWVWPIVAGHHGVIRRGSEVHRKRDGVPAAALGWDTSPTAEAPWAEIQIVLLDLVAQAVGFADLADAAPSRTPAKGVQLALSGLVIMADWVASSDLCPDKAATLEDLVMARSRHRGRAAWRRLELAGGWDVSAERPADLFAQRFGCAPRPVQEAVGLVVSEMPAPGLVIVEAPMGEGKTEAALAAVEIAAHRWGFGGLFVGMPTQATSDPMFARVHNWSRSLGGAIQFALSHGRARFNPLWRRLSRNLGPVEIWSDLDEAPGGGPEPFGEVGRLFFGRRRSLLTTICVGTVDNLLHAATRTKRVALRFAGLAGKVVVLDEVHSYSIYTAEFLQESLRWLGSAGCPVILLTATLPPELKESLLRAYSDGAAGIRTASTAPSSEAYPLVTWACPGPDGSVLRGEAAANSALRPRRVAIEVLQDEPGDGRSSGAQADLAALVGPVLAGGGRVLVVCNTVGRAQAAYAALRGRFAGAVELSHARFTAGERERRSRRIVERLGAAAAARNEPHVIVGTQVLEQSLDIDADLVVTDLAPMDLLLQRIGWTHRHPARDPHRPAVAKTPRVVVTGVRWGEDGTPLFPRGVDKIYSPDLLLRTAALIRRDIACGWELPSDIPGLVASTYSDDPAVIPAEWVGADAALRRAARMERDVRRQKARPHLLGFESGLGKVGLDGLHSYGAGELSDDDAASAVVRDGPESAEVVLVRCRGADWHTLSGRRLTRGRVPVDDSDRAIEEACSSLVRLPPWDALTRAALALRPPGVFESDPDLGGLRVLPLEEDGTARIGGAIIRYSDELGLLVSPLRQQRR